MTILQLKYAITIANSCSMREAAGKLFVSQPALSSSVNELEQELGIKIFDRTNKGIITTKEGEEFLIYAKQAVNRFDIIEDRYMESDNERKHFSVSMQHYVFAVHAFVKTIKQCNLDKYTFEVHETKTDEVLDNVKNLKSEVGIISYTKESEKILKKLIKEYQLVFKPLMICNTYAYMNKKHPLSGKKEISLEELKGYPCVSFAQSSENSFYINEEALGNYEFEKLIKTNDRGSSVDILKELDGYSIGTGTLVESEVFNSDFVSVKLKEEDPITIGYILRKNHKLSSLGQVYIENLEKYRGV